MHFFFVCVCWGVVNVMCHFGEGLKMQLFWSLWCYPNTLSYTHIFFYKRFFFYCVCDVFVLSFILCCVIDMSYRVLKEHVYGVVSWCVLWKQVFIWYIYFLGANAIVGCEDDEAGCADFPTWRCQPRFAVRHTLRLGALYQQRGLWRFEVVCACIDIHLYDYGHVWLFFWALVVYGYWQPHAGVFFLFFLLWGAYRLSWVFHLGAPPTFLSRW